MRTSQVALILGLTPLALARCEYHLSGSILNDPIVGWSWSGKLEDGLEIYENPILCGQGSGNNDGHQDENGNWIIGCQEGFALTLSGATAGTATMVNGALTDTWDTGASPDFFCCYGACDDGGATLECAQYDFTSDYNCGGCLGS
jgi:hypothetical protein